VLTFDNLGTGGHEPCFVPSLFSVSAGCTRRGRGTPFEESGDEPVKAVVGEAGDDAGLDVSSGWSRHVCVG